MNVGAFAEPQGSDAELRAFAATQVQPTGIPAEKIDAKAPESPATGTAEQVAPDTPVKPPAAQEPVKGVVIESFSDLRDFVEKKPATQPMSIRIPKTLYDDLKFIEKFGGKTMTQIIVSAVAPVVEELLAARGLKPTEQK